MIKFVQLVSHGSLLIALGEDGKAYMRTWDEITVPGEFEYDEYGGSAPLTKRVFRWEAMD